MIRPAQAAAFAVTGYACHRLMNRPQGFPLASAMLSAPLIAYILFTYLDGTEFTVKGRYRPKFAKQILPVLKWVMGPEGYVKGRVIAEDEAALKACKQAVMGGFPHGVLSLWHMLVMSDAADFNTRFPALSNDHRRDLAATVTFAIPVFRDLLLALGCVDADRKIAKKVLSKGMSVFILPGGELEQMLTQQGKHRVYLQKRKGFVKLALEHGVDLVPMYCFGETDLYSTSNFLLPLRWWICKNLRVALPLACGRWGTAIPHRCSLTAVIGKPIQVAQVTKPTDEQITELHAVFQQNLKDLFDKYKAEAGQPDAQLEVV